MICSHRFGHMVARCCKILQVPKHQKDNSSYINDVNDVMNLWCKRAIFPTLAALEGGLSYPCIVFGTRVTCIPGIRNGTILWPQIFTWSAVARSKFPPFPCTLHGRQTFQQSGWVCQRSCPQFLSWPRRRGGEEEDTLHSFLSWKHLPLSSSLISTTMCVGFPSTIQSTNGSMKLLWDLVMAALYFKCSVCTCFRIVYEIVNPSFGYFRMQVGRRGKREVLGGDAWILCRMSVIAMIYFLDRTWRLMYF